MAYFETPGTDAGNATYLTNANNIENLAPDSSFLSPLKKQDSLVLQLQKDRGNKLKASRYRTPLADRNHVRLPPPQAEFTPLLKSATKRNQIRRNGEVGVETPAFLKPGFKAKSSPVLPQADTSMVYGDESRVIADAHDEKSLLRQMASSSAQSTPLATLPLRNGREILLDQGNPLTLREQENIVDKIEKENFGLKLKIHHLEMNLRRAAPEFNEITLKENTDLKVGKVIMQKELHQTRKTLQAAERDIEAFRLHLQDLQEKLKRKQADEGMRKELESLRHDVDVKNAEVEDLQQRLQEAENKEGVTKLNEDLEDLEADLREKERLLDFKDGEIDKLKEQARQEADKIAELEQEVQAAKSTNIQQQVLQDSVKILQEDLRRANAEKQEAKEEKRAALEEKEKAEEDLYELRQEIADKSFTTKGLNRQLDEKASRLQDELEETREKYSELQQSFDERGREMQLLQDDLDDYKKDGSATDRKLREDVELLRHEHSSILRKRDGLTAQVQALTNDLYNKSDEKELLQGRHDALTEESQSLQRDLNKKQVEIEGLEQTLEEERRHSLENDRNLRTEAKEETQRLSAEINHLRRELEDEQNRFDANQDRWDSQKLNLESQKTKAEERAAKLEEQINKLLESEGALTTVEKKLKDTLKTERTRHRIEEAAVTRQVKELQAEIDNKRTTLIEVQSQLARTEEDLEISESNQIAAEDKIQGLEDEIEVLQSSLDEEIEHAKKQAVEIRSLRDQLSTTDRSFKERAESRLTITETQLQHINEEKEALQNQLDRTNRELEVLQKAGVEKEGDHADIEELRIDLSLARTQQNDYVLQHVNQKQKIRELKQEVSNLKRQIQENELSKLAINSPRSSTDGSARKVEVTELRRQLGEAHQQMKTLQVKMREIKRETQSKYATLEEESHRTIGEQEQQIEQHELEQSDLKRQIAEHTTKNEFAEQTIKRLRSRIHSLEKDLHNARLRGTDDYTMAEERKDLHDLLKDAKLEAEELQLRVSERDSRIHKATLRENELNTQIRRLRREVSSQTQKASALMTELESLQRRHEHSIEYLASQQQAWEQERKALTSGVRFPNNSISEPTHGGNSTELLVLENEIQEKEKRHAAELRGLVKHCQWIKAKFLREEGFRAALIHEKNYLLLQIAMYKACNKEDLRLLDEINAIGSTGQKPKRKASPAAGKKPTLKVVATMVRASVRMKNMQLEWAVQKLLGKSLQKKYESMKRERGRKASHEKAIARK